MAFFVSYCVLPSVQPFPFSHLNTNTTLMFFTYYSKGFTALFDRLRNKEIAEIIFVAEGTVKKHIYNICQKWR